MAFIHGKNTYVSLAGEDLSAYTTTSNLALTADSHDTTTYGKDAHVFAGGLLNGTASMSGIYDDTGDGPHDTIVPLVGTVVALVRRPEGTGSGKPQETVDVLVVNYTETNPVADMVAWSVELQLSDDVTEANQ